MLPKCSKMLFYNSFILTKIDYCLPIWGNAAQVHLNKIWRLTARYNLHSDNDNFMLKNPFPHKEIFKSSLSYAFASSLLANLVNPEMLSTKRFYDENAIYRSHGLRNCRMLICIYVHVAFFSIALISILIRSNDKIKKIFIFNPPRVFIQVSRPMFSTMRNSFTIILHGYCQYGC